MEKKKLYLDLKIGAFLDKDIKVLHSDVISENGDIVPVDKSELPVELPDDIDLNSPGNPLEKHPKWKHTIHKATGKKAVRRQIH